MPPEESTPQPAPESPTPAIEAPAPAAEPVTPLETSPAPAEVVPAPETAPDPAEATTGTQPTTPTAQIPPNEPIAPESEPIEHAPEPPSAAAPTPTSRIRDLLTRARVAIQDRKRKKRDKIMLALATKDKITNDEVEKLLHVSDATATRYLSALEKEGKIKQIGKTGTGVSYSKT